MYQLAVPLGWQYTASDALHVWPIQGYVWALGLLAAGQSSTMTGTYTGQVRHYSFFCSLG